MLAPEGVNYPQLTNNNGCKSSNRIASIPSAAKVASRKVAAKVPRRSFPFDGGLGLAAQTVLFQPLRQIGVGQVGPFWDGRTLPAVFKSESAALGFITSRVAKGTETVADEAASWNNLQARYAMQRIDHQSAYSHAGVYSNNAESFFSRMRRAEIGHHHHVAGACLVRYAQEASWREDHRRVDNGRQVRGVMALAMAAPVSVDWCGYWQKGGAVGAQKRRAPLRFYCYRGGLISRVRPANRRC